MAQINYTCSHTMELSLVLEKLGIKTISDYEFDASFAKALNDEYLIKVSSDSVVKDSLKYERFSYIQILISKNELIVAFEDHYKKKLPQFFDITLDKDMFLNFWYYKD